MRNHSLSGRARLTLSSTAILTAFLSPAVAQGSAPTRLAPIEVSGGGEEGPTAPVTGYVAKQSSTGSKSATELKDIPQTVSVVGRDEMEDRGITNKVDEALLYTPGITSQPYGPDPDTDWFYIRGFNATQSGVFFDNLGLLSHGFGGFQIDPFMLERVEVLKGPASVLYGGANPGGIVNLVRKRPTDQPLYETEIGVDTNGNGFAGFDFSDQLGSSGAVHYRLTGKVAGGDTYSDFSEDLRGFLLPQVEFAPDDETRLTLWGFASGLDQVHTGNGFFPYVGTVENAPFGKIPRDAFYGEPAIDNGTYVQKMLGYEFERTFDNGITFTQNARYGHLRKHEEGPYLNGYVGGAPTGPDYLLARIGFEGRSEVNAFSMDNRLEGQADLGGATHNLLAGIDYTYYRLDDWQACCGATPISATDPVYGTPQGANFVYADDVVTRKQVGLYVQDRVEFEEGWILTLNGRYDFVDTKQVAEIGNTYASQDNAASGRAGLAYAFDNGVTPYVSVATFFNPLIGTRGTDPADPFNPAKVAALEPEEGHQIEGGVKYEPGFFDGSFTASVFQIVKQNAAVPNPSNANLTEQLGEVTSTGFEFEAKANLNDNWKLTGAYSYTHLKITEDPNPALVGNSPFIVPAHQASLWLDYAFTAERLEGLSIGGGIRYQGESWADNENTKKVPGAAVFDLGLRYEKENWRASVNVANLFDKDYVKSCGGLTVCGYGEARTVTFKLSRTW